MYCCTAVLLYCCTALLVERMTRPDVPPTAAGTRSYTLASGARHTWQCVNVGRVSGSGTTVVGTEVSSVVKTSLQTCQGPRGPWNAVCNVVVVAPSLMAVKSFYF